MKAKLLLLQKKGLTRLELQLFLTAIAQEKAKLVENKTSLLNYLNQKKIRSSFFKWNYSFW